MVGVKSVIYKEDRLQDLKDRFDIMEPEIKLGLELIKQEDNPIEPDAWRRQLKEVKPETPPWTNLQPLVSTLPFQLTWADVNWLAGTEWLTDAGKVFLVRFFSFFCY